MVTDQLGGAEIKNPDRRSAGTKAPADGSRVYQSEPMNPLMLSSPDTDLGGITTHNEIAS